MILSAALLGGCADKDRTGTTPKSVIETGYLTCAPDAAACPGAQASCLAEDGSKDCVALPDACDGVVSCACLGETVCGDNACSDKADTQTLHCEAKDPPDDPGPTGDPVPDPEPTGVPDPEPTGPDPEPTGDPDPDPEPTGDPDPDPEPTGDPDPEPAPDPSDACAPGDTFDAPDGCNTCTCPDSGKISEAPCTEMACVDPDPDPDPTDACTPGDIFDAPDGCNTCTCPASGKISEAGCTEMACVDPDPDPEPEVSCMDPSGSIFPEFDDTCSADADCMVALHQINCCGTQIAIGINVAEGADFKAAEAICQGQYPGCGCAQFPTEADDGNTGYLLEDFAASCMDGACWTSVVEAD